MINCGLTVSIIGVLRVSSLSVCIYSRNRETNNTVKGIIGTLPSFCPTPWHYVHLFPSLSPKVGHSPLEGGSGGDKSSAHPVHCSFFISLHIWIYYIWCLWCTLHTISLFSFLSPKPILCSCSLCSQLADANWDREML